MKKLLVALFSMLAIAGTSMAQTPATAQKPAKAKTAATTAKKETTAATTVAPAKKDGTPDMRYKANKEAAKKPAVHTKKDGTPDKRYKENKKP